MLQLFFLKSPANGYMICYGMYGLLTERLHLCGRAWSEMLIINHCHAKPQKDYKNIDVEHEIIFVSEVNSFMVKTQVWLKQGTQSEKTKKYPLVDGIIKKKCWRNPRWKTSLNVRTLWHVCLANNDPITNYFYFLHFWHQSHLYLSIIVLCNLWIADIQIHSNNFCNHVTHIG